MVHILKLQIPVPKTMVVGIDVYHDTAPGGRRSVAGIIASTNANFTKYYSRVTIQSQVRFRFQTDEGLALLLDARHVRVRACVGPLRSKERKSSMGSGGAWRMPSSTTSK